MVIEIPAFETLEKKRYIKSFRLNPLQDALQPATKLPLPSHHSALDTLTQRATSGQGTACSLSATVRVCRECLNLK